MTKGSRLAIALALAGAFAPGAGAEEAKPPAQPVNPRMETMREHEKKLDDLMAKMNEAKGEAKVDAIAAVLNELMAQRKEALSRRGSGAGMMRVPRQRPTEPKPAP